MTEVFVGIACFLLGALFGMGLHHHAMRQKVKIILSAAATASQLYADVRAREAYNAELREQIQRLIQEGVIPPVVLEEGRL